MSADNIDLPAIQSQFPAINCQCVDRIASTQSAVKPNSLLIADEQTAGVGRRGHHWSSPAGRSISLSLRQVLPLTARDLSGYQMTVALAVADSIQQFEPEADIQLKWPNDLYHLDQKFAGILINLIPQSNLTEVIVGVGINWSLSAEQLQQVDQPVCNIPLSNLPSRTAFIVALLHHIKHHNKQFIDHGLAPSLNQWQNMDWFTGRTLNVRTANSLDSGQYVGINQQGELQIQTPTGIKHFSSGEVSVKAL